MTSQNELLMILEKGGKWNVSRANIEECVTEGERRMEKGFFEGAMVLLERNVLFGNIGNSERWENNGGNFELEKAVKGVSERLERDGKANCGCR